MNNVCIVGIASKEQFVNAMLKYCNPEDLVIHIFPSSNIPQLREAAYDLHATVNIMEPTKKQYGLTKIIIFTDWIGTNEVMSVQEAIEVGVPITFLNPKFYK